MSCIDAVVTILSDCCDTVVLVKKEKGGAAAVDIYWRMKHVSTEEVVRNSGNGAEFGAPVRTNRY